MVTKTKFEVSRSRADVRLHCNHKKGRSEAVVEADWTKLHELSKQLGNLHVNATTGGVPLQASLCRNLAAKRSMTRVYLQPLGF